MGRCFRKRIEVMTEEKLKLMFHRLEKENDSSGSTWQSRDLLLQSLKKEFNIED